MESPGWVLVAGVMFRFIVRRLSLLALAVLCLQLGFAGSVQSAAEGPLEVKELNFVFLHGAAGGNPCRLQPLADSIVEQIPEYVRDYEQANPGIKVRVATLNRCYPDGVDVDTWAQNIAGSIDRYLPGKGSVILIGHSMGGKSAIHAAANNVGGLAERVALVVTINSPIKSLDKYEVTGGGSMVEFCRAARWFGSGQGVCESVAYHDSSEDGKWVADNKHWLAFTSSENAPLSEQFDYGGFDPYPKDMDDGVIPLTAQYADGADVVYYGEYGHSDFASIDEVADSLAAQILRYVFGGSIECFVFARGGSFGHEAGGLLGTDYWQDVVGDVLARSGRLWHRNKSYTNWQQEWEDVVEYCPPTYEDYERSRYEIRRLSSSSLLTSIEESRWLEPDDPEDFRLCLRTRAAPHNQIQVDWEIYRKRLLRVGTKRDHYEVEIVAGTPLAGVRGVSWATDDPRDLRIQITSSAERPFRWFEAEWRVYYKESRERRVIDEIPALPEAPPAR